MPTKSPKNKAPAVHCNFDKMVKIDALVENPRNPNTHNSKQVSLLAKIIGAQGWRNPIVVSKRSGFIVSGHGRLKAARELGLESVPVNEQPFKTEVDEWAHLVADNRIAELAEMDNLALKDLLSEMDTGEIDMDFTGYDHDALEDLMTQFYVGDENEEIPERSAELSKKWGSERGQVWQLGGHRVACGDAGSKEDMAALLNGQRVNMVFTDPPYGIGYNAKTRWPDGYGLPIKSKKNRGPVLKGDDKPFDPSIILETFPRVPEIFIWGFQNFAEKLRPGGIIVWNRKTASQGETAWLDFELCWSKKPRSKMAWITWGGFKHTEKGEERWHTTQKPVELVEWFFKRWGKRGNVVADIYLGSGTTLMACENTGRKCYGMEIDPGNVAVVLERWKSATGNEPQKL